MRQREILPLLLLAGAALATLAAPTASAQDFIRGDATGDTLLNIADPIFQLTYIYDGTSPPPPPLDRADTNDNGVLEIADAVYMLRNLFFTGGPPPAPFPNPGPDVTPPNFPTQPNGTLEFRLGSADVCGGIANPIGVFVTNTTTMEALNYRIAFDPAEATFVESNCEALELLLGSAPAFFDEFVSGDSISLGILFSFVDPTGQGLAPQIDAHIGDLLFEPAPFLPPGSVITFTLEDDLVSVPPSINMGSVLGEAVLAELTGNGTLTLTCLGVDYLRGDHNEDAAVSVSDVVHIIDYLFLGGPAGGCERAGDTNNDDAVDIADAITLVDMLFGGGAALAPPFPICDTDAAQSAVPCAGYGAACP